MHHTTPHLTHLRIGITLGLHQVDESLWLNGIKQNALFMCMVFQAMPRVHSVHLINMTDTPVTAQLPWNIQRWPTVSFDDVKEDLDVLIELGGEIGPQRTAQLKAKGTRIVSYCCGFEYIHAMEAILFKRPLWGAQFAINQRYDAIWMIPQVAESSRDFFQTFRRRPTEIVPFVWAPDFLEQRCLALPHAGLYRSRGGPARLSVMEPNHDVVKFCLYPILIAEEVFRRRAQDIAFLHVTNAQQLAEGSPEFIGLMNHLDIVRQHKATFVGRFDTAYFLSTYTDIVISHQWGNPLNYFYLDVCWLGYPLVHNAELCKDLGYYYSGNDVSDGARMLELVLDNHDRQCQRYLESQRAGIARFHPHHPQVTASYEALLLRVMRQPLA